MPKLPPIYTLGYFGLEWITFISLLTRYGIEEVLDVRTSPTSPFLPCFSRPGLERDLPLWGRRYRAMGPELGSRRTGLTVLDAVSRARGLDAVMALRDQGRRLVLLCVEEDPRRCHRGLDLTPALQARGADVIHIRGDGRLEPEPRPPRRLDADGKRAPCEGPR